MTPSGTATAVESVPRVAHYEDLRGRVLAGGALGCRLGLALLLREGMAAWLERGSLCPGGVPPAGPERRLPEKVVPDGNCADVVRLLAHMVLSGLEEKRA